MPRVPATPCSCGCGQAPAETVRNRVVQCGCGFSFRTSRQWLAAMGELPRCPICTDRMDIPCLLDLFAMSEEVAEASPQYADACRKADNRIRVKAGKGTGRRAPYRPLCGRCSHPMMSTRDWCKGCGFQHDGRGGGHYAGVPRNDSEPMPF